MTKGVLGNDPFQRGAAPRTGEVKDDAADPKAAKKSAGSKSAKGAKSAGKAKSAKGGAPKSGAQAKAPRGGKAAEAKQATATPKTPAAKVHMFEARTDGRGSARHEQDARDVEQASEAKHGRSSAKDAHASGQHPAGEDVSPLREPSVPGPAAEPRPSRPQVLAEEVHGARPQERKVDRALTEALASEAAETAAKTAVDELFEGQKGPDRDIERILATELVAEVAESAVRQVLDHGHGEASEREVATAVATQVAEATAGVAVDEVLDHDANGPEERALDEDGEGGWPTDAWIRDPKDVPPEDTGDTWTADAWRRDPEGMSAPEDPEENDDLITGVERVEENGVHISVSIIEGAAPTDVEPEVELPDETHDELPPSRRPLSLVSDPGGAPLPEEAERAAQGYDRPEEPAPASGFAGRAAGMFSLAKEIAGQALASEGLGRAVGAMHGLMEAMRTSLGAGGGSRLDDYGKDAGLVESLQPVLDFLYEQYWRVSVEGVDQVPRGASILVANHSGALPYDGLVMAQALLRERPDLPEARWLVEDQVFHAPMLGTLFNRLGAVRASPENALRLLDEHRPLVVFPEGYQGASKPFAERYRLKRFGRGGFVKLALRTGAPIVPVAIVGAEETSPLLGRLPGGFLGFPSLPLTAPGPLPAKWTIRFGEPITMEGLAPEAADDLGEVQRLTERTRESIQGMLQALLRERRSVFTG
ncbi:MULTISPECIES: 1-acyl-sn-glycerol-3-phosphate acyltransferase [unclassified Corallococcus]|uniref:1-acyl-sn-glycerol-3-phosphate acyltransferase n=1 Tax=unclassified Corallococcus TaxID=2685029 RepID=UPI001A907221|nr:MULTISPECIES: 1-acyl-sn-glycerol-3-phosphate acyltransferase [unclassified Corallococcus]MBN9685066.1 1-acyl-sn-glycerol-3-phosphate acyltransferase [Corallococcus sp. NCSPR001]WAS83475.1 1-acyl-sn-glycerol-3-phosphate acyltransferase [Corallococcus sp. NCRR]